ncbi:hypothetical protein [Allohahella marinimesophila]|uniref:Tetratricopeptide repeat protein n=1 Tax=Allohahella marinimesophila TaxID=1054972 RepID=A0ABP7PP41_9GAMM
MSISTHAPGLSNARFYLKLLFSLTLLFITACKVDTPSDRSAAFQPEDPGFVVVAEGELPPLATGMTLQSPERFRQLIDDTIKRGDDERDPRFYGYAEGMVRQRLETHPEDVGALLTLADLLQKQHAFEEATHVFEQVIQLAPANPQAYLSMAMLARQRGDFAGMEKLCRQLLARAGAEVAAICIYAAQGLQGKLGSSYEELERVIERPLHPAINRWARQEAAEMAARLGQPDRARAHWTAALEAAGSSVPPAELLVAIADFYLLEQQPLDVIDLLAGETEMPALAMRLAAADVAVAAGREEGDADAVRSKWVDELQPWLDLWTARGEQSHAGELAYYLFAVRAEPEQALEPAFAQWSARKEPQDTLLLLEIISQLGEDSDVARQSLQSVEEWLKQTGYEDQRIRSLLAVAS